LLNGANDADGQGDDGADELEDSADGDAQDAEGNEEEPHDRIGDERQESQGPAENEEDVLPWGASIRARAPGLVCGEAFEANS